MNSMGEIFRIHIYGSSHGPKIGVIVEGCPAGIPLCTNDFIPALTRRKAGKKGTTSRKEPDLPEILSGIYKGETTGTPIEVSFSNTNLRSEDYDFNGFFRPGHADFTNYVKFKGKNDPRGGGQSSGRMTVALVAAGVVAQKIIHPVEIHAELIEAGGSENIQEAVENVVIQKDSIGGIVLCSAKGIPVGWGEPFFQSLESRISSAIFSIPGIKAIGFGAGVDVARMKGSECNDVYIDENGTTCTNNAGGIHGGISNGNDLEFKVYVKPTSSIGLPQNTFNFTTKKMEDFAISGRHDACFALRVPPVIEAVTACVLADVRLMAKSK